MDFLQGDDFLPQTHAALTQALLATNSDGAPHGLCLTAQDAAMLIQVSHDAILTQDRLEFGESAILPLIRQFQQSRFLAPGDYADTLATLLDIFYEVKEESLDLLTDEEVISLMFEAFETTSCGSVELLQTRDMEWLCRRVRNRALSEAGVTGLEEGDDDE